MRVDTGTGVILSLVKVRYLKEDGQLSSNREYTYYTEDTLKIGDKVTVPVRGTVGKAIVSTVDVPESEITAFKDKVKVIPADSIVNDEPAQRPEPEADLWWLDDELKSELSIETEKAAPLPEQPQSITAELLEEIESPDDNSFTEIELPPGTALIRVEPGKDPEVIKYIGMVMEATRKADAFVVDSPEQAKTATDNIKILATTRKDIEALKKNWLAPLIEREQEIKKAFDLLLTPLSAAEQVYRTKGTNYMLKQKEIRDQQEAAAKLQQQANQASIEAARASGESVVDIKPVPQVTAPEPVKTVRAQVSTGSLRTTKKWRYRKGFSLKQIKDALPDEYLMVNETKLGRDVRARDSRLTEEDLGGVIEIYEDAAMMVR